MTIQPFFIIGTKRGGTTLLRLMLNMHSELSIPPESHFFIPLLREFRPESILDAKDLDKALLIIKSHPRFKTWKISKMVGPGGIKESINPPISLSDFIDILFKLETGDSNRKRWGDKTPEYVDIIPSLTTLFPSADFIFLMRDGRDVAISLKDRGWHGWSIYQRACYWRQCIDNVFLFAPGKSLFLKYEDLVRFSSQTLSKVCTFLKVDYESQMLDFSLNYSENITKHEKEANVHTKLSRRPSEKDSYRWRMEASAFDVWAFESVAYHQLLKAGYHLSYFKPSNVFHQFGKVLYSVWGGLVSLTYRLYHFIIPKSAKVKLGKISAYKVIRNVIRGV